MTVTLLDEHGQKIAEKRVTIIYDGSMYYTVQPAMDVVTGGETLYAEVSAAHVPKQLADINVDASNKLFTEYTKYDSFLNNCPYWLGSRERIENGVRYT